MAYYSKAQKYNFIKKYKDSNMTASAFCRENGLNVNWKFNYSGEGAKSSCFMFSLIQTAKANGLNPDYYLRNVFEQAPFCQTEEDWKKLLPWNIEMRPFEDRDEWI